MRGAALNTTINHYFLLLISIGGDLDLGQVITGKIADFNMWNFQMQIDYLDELSCKTEGDLVSWNSLQVFGVAAFSLEDLPCSSKHSNFVALKYMTVNPPV